MNQLETLLTQALDEAKKLSAEALQTGLAKAALQQACDRAWGDESLLTTAIIVSNTIYNRDEQIKYLTLISKPSDPTPDSAEKWIIEFRSRYSTDAESWEPSGD